MTKFDQKSFGIGAPKDNKYRDNWDSVFGKKDEVPSECDRNEILREPEESRPCPECVTGWLCDDCWSKFK